MYQLTTLTLLLISLLLFPGCKKEKCTAGTGGNLVVKANMIHHTRGIKGCTMRIKFCESELPGTASSDYDLNIKGHDADTFVVASGLKAGDYFFYGEGIDSLIFDNVSGGQPFTLSESSDTIKINIYITEVH